jgi:23S rRNA (cytidine2498-2'-O)-methyltransferase
MTSPHVQDSSIPTPKTLPNRFIFVACQQGAEVPFKNRYMGKYTPFRLAFSRPGLVTFKISYDQDPAKLRPQWLARLVGEGVGNVRGLVAQESVEKTLELAGTDFQAIHIFQRDRALPGQHDFEPGPTELTQSIGVLFGQKLQSLKVPPISINAICPIGSKVLDVILVEPDQWLIGHHTAKAIWECWPGGAYPMSQPQKMVSRAYRKITEALAWSQLPMQVGDRVVEIGSAPGGSCQRLLDIGMHVTGVDPAEMDSLLLAHPRFEHWRSKSAGIKRKLFSRFKWLTADANVAPNYTLDAVEDIVSYPTSKFEGLLLTFKMSTYDMIEQVVAAAERIGTWGFSQVQIRQLASNRRECCLAAKR